MCPSLIPRLLLLPLTLLGLTACGVTFSSHFDGTEVFKSIEVTGEMTPGSLVTVTTVVTQPYSMPLHISCMYEKVHDLSEDERRIAFFERADVAGEVVLEPNLDAEPGDDLPERELSFDFRVEETGDYFVACLTPAAPENGFGTVFTVVDES